MRGLNSLVVDRDAARLTRDCQELETNAGADTEPAAELRGPKQPNGRGDGKKADAID